MIPRVFIDDEDVSGSVLFESLWIRNDSDTRVATAGFTMRSSATPARWDEARWDEDRWSINAELLAKVRIVDISVAPNVPKFGGYLSYFEYERPKPGELWVAAQCQDYAVWLENIVIPSHDFGLGQSDQAILQYAINTYASGKLTATGVQMILPVVPLGLIQNWTLRQLVEWIADLSNAHWHVSPEGNLIYHRQSAQPTALGLSDQPDLVTTFKLAMRSFSKDFARPINHAIINGAALSPGVTLNVEYQDPVSVDRYGRYTTTTRDPELTDANEARLRAEAIVTANAYPRDVGQLVTYVDYFQVGDYVPIRAKEFGVDGRYLFTSSSIKQLNRTQTEYTFGFGQKAPDAMRLLRVLERHMRTETGVGVVTGIPAPGSVTVGSLAPGFLLNAGYIESVNANTIQGQLNAHQINTVAAGSIVGQINAVQINTVSATSIEGVIVADQIGGVYTTVLQGVIVSNQLVDEIINDLSKFQDALRPVPQVPTLPGLPNHANYPARTYVFNEADGHFYYVNDTETAWVPDDNVTGAQRFYHIGRMTANQITGLIVSAQIESIVAGKIVGQIVAAQINSVNASALVGSINAANITAVNVTALQGLIAAAQIGSVNATTILGTLQGSSIANINAATITIGLLDTDNRISRIAGAKLDVGSINSDKLNATAIAVGGGGGKPGRIDVYNASGSAVIGFVGTSGTTEGGYFKTLGVGGTQAAPSLFSNASGFTTLTNADFYVTTVSNGAVEIRSTAFDPSYSSVGMLVKDAALQFNCWHVSKGIVGRKVNMSLYSLNADPNRDGAGECVIYRDGAIVILLAGGSGIVRADGFQQAGNVGITATIPASSTLTVRGGIITGYV